MATPKLSDEEYERIRPRGGCLLLAAPLFAVPAVIMAYLYLFYSGYQGVDPSGNTVQMQFHSCDEAGQMVLARAEDMGLGNTILTATDNGFVLASVLPDREDAAAEIATTFGSVGLFALRAGDIELANQDDVVDASVRLDITMTPSTLINLNEEARKRIYRHIKDVPEGKMEVWLEGEMVWDYGNQRPMINGEIEVPPSAADDQARMKLAAHRAIVLNNGPLPCAIELQGVTTVSRIRP